MRLLLRAFEKVAALVFIMPLAVGVYEQASAQDLRELYKKVDAAVVVIYTQEQDVVQTGNISRRVTSGGLGSGFLISDKQVITAAHVVEVANQVNVQFVDGEVIPARVVSLAGNADVALLELIWAKKNPVTVSLGNSDELEVGEQIFIVGAPFGLEHSLSSGYVSGFKKQDRIAPFLKRDFIQTDAAINTGNSGGPMFNLKGEVVGIVSNILSRSGGFDGIGFAATSNIAKELLLDNHFVWSGVDIVPLTGTMARVFNIPQSAGLLVERVAILSPLAELGVLGGSFKATIEGEELIVGGDIILSINDLELTFTEQNYLDISNILRDFTMDNVLTVKILRGGKILTLQNKR